MGMDSQVADDAQFESGYDDKPTETPAKSEPENKQAEAVQETPPAEAAPVDPLKEVIARLDKFQASHDTLAGNLGRLQQRQNEFQNEVQANLAAAQAATRIVSDAPTQAQVKSAAADPQKWGLLKKEWPDWAAAIEEFHDSRKSDFDAKAFETSIKQEMEGQTAAVRKEIINSALDAVYPGWVDEVRSDAFGKWISGQPDAVKALSQSDKVSDAAKMLKLYDASKQVKPPAAPAKQEISPREKRLAAAINPRGAGGHAASSTELDEFESGYTG